MRELKQIDSIVDDLDHRVQLLTELTDHQSHQIFWLRGEVVTSHVLCWLMVAAFLCGKSHEYWPRWTYLCSLAGATIDFAWIYRRMTRYPVVTFAHYVKERKRQDEEFFGPAPTS